jgi:sulfate adenylyltransferase subunit 2
MFEITDCNIARPTIYHLPRHLRQLEAESIGIIREVAAEFCKPVILYSIGKDSSVLLHLAMKAFNPAKVPFPILHIDTTWKFREMITFRDDTAKRLGLDLIVHVNQEGLDRGSTSALRVVSGIAASLLIAAASSSSLLGRRTQRSARSFGVRQME